MVAGAGLLGADAGSGGAAACGCPGDGGGAGPPPLFSKARFGILRWEQLVFPAERLARFGHPASRAFAAALAEAFPRIAPDSDA